MGVILTRVILFFLIAVTFSSCITKRSGDFEKEAIHIIDVEIHIPQPTNDNELSKITNTFEERFRNAMLNYAAVYNKTKTGRIEGYKIKVSVKNVHFKNALISLIVGDANRMSAKAEIIDPTTNQILRTYENIYTDGGSAILNGISGAVLSVSVGKFAAETTLIRGMSKLLLNTAFLLESTPATVRRVQKEQLFEPPIAPISPLVTVPAEPTISSAEADAADQLLELMTPTQ